MFGGDYGTVEPSDTLFADGQPQGTVDWVQWQTPAPITLESITLFAGHDTSIYYRGFSRFSLYYWNTGDSQWTDIYNFYPANPYGNSIAPANTYVDPGFVGSDTLALAANITPVDASYSGRSLCRPALHRPTNPVHGFIK